MSIAVALGAVAAMPNALDSFQASSVKPAALGIAGHGTVTLMDSDGNVKAYREVDNIIVNDGINEIVNCIFNTGTACGAADYEWLAIGSDGSPADSDDASLGAELAATGRVGATGPEGSCVAGVSGATGTSGVATGSSSTVTLCGMWTIADADGPTDIEEVGIFDAASGGNMFSRFVLDPEITQAQDGDMVVITYEVLVQDDAVAP